MGTVYKLKITEQRMTFKIFGLIVIILMAVIIFLLLRLHNAEKAKEKAVQKEREEQKKKNELKNEITNSTHSDNIASTLDLLHNHK